MKKVLSIAIAAVMLIAVSVLPAFADSINSPGSTKANYVIHIIGDDEGGHVVMDYKTDVDESGKQTVVITGIPDAGYEFTKWIIDGDFVPQGDLTDASLELIISSDITAQPVFTKIQSGTDATTATKSDEPKNIDYGNKSPKTGSSDGAVVAILIVAVLALGAVVFVAKRRSTDK